MKDLIKDYYLEVGKLLEAIEVKNEDGGGVEFCKGVSGVIKLIRTQASEGRKLIFIGNGASAAISSHQATDFWKNGGIRAIAFNDACLLTCVSNDFGYNRVFEKPIEMFAEPGDILFAISSSGKSKNILQGTEAAKKKGVRVVTLSGFSRNNPLSKIGEVNFYVPSSSYGQVEITHHCLCHCILDIIIKTKAELDRR